MHENLMYRGFLANRTVPQHMMQQTCMICLVLSLLFAHNSFPFPPDGGGHPILSLRVDIGVEIARLPNTGDPVGFQ
jgi:hypothetical protein